MRFLENKTTVELKKWNKICFGIAIVVLLEMFALVGISLFQISDGTQKAVLTSLGPSILLPFIFVPLLFSARINSELKKRNN